MDKKKNKQILLAVLLVLGIIVLTVGVTYAFFNYTRTGIANNLGTGRIYFNTSQNGRLQLTNIFPVKSADINTNTLDTVTVGIVGDTTYENGEEFLISLVDVNNTVNNKQIPIKYIATYEATAVEEGEPANVIGTASNDYWTARNSKDANIYLLNGTGAVEENAQVLVGYIDNGDTGINGTLTIKAYIDGDRIAISDTYNPNAVAPNSGSGTTPIPGTGEETPGTQTTNNLEKISPTLLASDSSSSENPTTDEYGTTSEWVNGRTVLTTEEWNSFQTSGTPISFKIKAESNEGIWVKKPSKSIASCPDCKFMYYVVDPDDESTWKWTTWNMGGYDETNDESYALTPTQITSGLYDNYEELMATTGKNYFLGVKLNNNNEVTNAYACGVKDNEPFCIEGTVDGSKYAENQALLQGANLWNNTCTVNGDLTSGFTQCGSYSGSLSAYAYSDGIVVAGVGLGGNCGVTPDGRFVCLGSGAVEPDPSEPGGGGGA